MFFYYLKQFIFATCNDIHFGDLHKRIFIPLNTFNLQVNEVSDLSSKQSLRVESKEKIILSI